MQQVTLTRFLKSKHFKISLFILWIGINFIQAAFTELAHDEAYYWMYANYLDFGYFDHPPMIAVLIKSGGWLFNGEIGVRLMIVICNALTFYLIYLLTDRKRFFLLFAILCSISVSHVYSFIAVPDAPLLTFSALFFLLYKRFSVAQNTINTILLSIAIALLLYSKYHGILLLFFTLLSNLSLFKKKQFYFVILLSIILYSPHIYWQIVNNYPSYKYHVLNKSQFPYQPLDTLIYIGGQLLIYGPIAGFILFTAAVRFKPETSFDRTLKFNLYGILLFFLFSTLNARVEPNWTILIFIPLVILAYQFIGTQPKWQKWMRYISISSLILFALLRIELMHHFIPDSFIEKSEFHGWKNWAEKISSHAENKPVVFMNSYQKASKYAFYSGQQSMSLNNVRYRRNQYDLWPIENKLQGQTVFLIPNWDIKEFQYLKTDKGNYNYCFIDNFRSYGQVSISTNLKNDQHFSPGTNLDITLSINNLNQEMIRFDSNKSLPVKLVYTLFYHEEYLKEDPLIDLNKIQLSNSIEMDTPLTLPEKKGIYYYLFSIKSGWLPPSINSNLVRIIIE